MGVPGVALTLALISLHFSEYFVVVALSLALPSQKIKLLKDNFTHLFHQFPHYIMSNQLPEEYWDSLGDNGVFLRTLLANQAGQLKYLQHQNQLLQNQLGSIQSNLANATSAAAIAAT